MNLSAGAKRAGLVVLLLAVIAVLFWLIGLATPRGPRFELRVTGPEETVFDWSNEACSATDIPDAPARAFRDSEGRVQLIAAFHETRRMIGPDLDHLRRDCRVVMGSHRDPDPTRFDDREWIASLYTADGDTVYALIHGEYQGHRHPGRCPSGEYRDCWYNTITLAVSTDGGDSYVHAEPPDHLVAAIPYRYDPGSGPMGAFSPTNIVRSPRDGLYYVLFRTLRYRQQPQGTTIMRTDDLSEPHSWRAWNGRRFGVRFVNPYTENLAERWEHLARPLSDQSAFEVATSLTYNTHLQRYLLIAMRQAKNPLTGKSVSGVYYSISSDLLGWTPVRMLFRAPSPRTHQPGDPNPIAYPSALDPLSPSRSFETTGRRFYLYFTRFNYDASPRDPFDRDLVRVPVEIVAPG